jgi:hypothetical protein
MLYMVTTNQIVNVGPTSDAESLSWEPEVSQE